MGRKKAEIYDRTWLEKARLERGLTQTSVAKAAGVNNSDYNRIERGLQEPRVKAGIRICEFLKLNPRSFLSEKPIG